MIVRFANLMVTRTPDASGLIPDDISLVNLYRTILNHYFDAQLPLLPARQYTSPFDWPYDFSAVQLADNLDAAE